MSRCGRCSVWLREKIHRIPIVQSDQHWVYPAFLEKVLGHPEKTVEHIVTHE